MNAKLLAFGAPVLLIAPVLISGCANFTPYVLPKSGESCTTGADQTQACAKVPALAGAVNDVAGLSKSVARNLGGSSNLDLYSWDHPGEWKLSSTATRKAIDVATFGLVTALGVQAARGGATRNLALGAAATYAAGGLFASPTTDSLYLATYSSLICISDKGNSVLASFISANQRMAQNSESIKTLGTAQSCQAQNATGLTAADVDAAMVSYAAAQAAIDRVSGSDAEIGEKLRLAANNVLSEMNRQLLANSPSLDAISKAAKSESSISSALLAQTAPAPLSSSFHAENSNQCPIHSSDLAKAKSQFDSIALSVASALNAVGDLSTGCTATPAIPLKALAVQQSSVELFAGKTFNLVISGGRPPYSYSWSGSTPEASLVTAQMIPESSVLAISATDAVTEKSFALQVTDSAVVQSSVTVSVATHAKPASTPAPLAPK